jgi:ADP-ribose pyrophosphatase
MALQIRQVDVAQVIDLRWAVMRPGRPRESASFPGDDDPRTRHWAAFDGATVVGCASVLDAPLGPAGPRWQLRGMAVATAQQRHGVGRRLLDTLCAEIAAPMWCNARERALPFYTAAGWQIVSGLFDVPGVGPHRRMVWSLEAPLDETLFSGRFLRMVRRDGWEFAQRVRASGVVGIIAVTPEGGLLLVEQPRTPLGGRVLELPAGLAGDLADAPDEAMVEAARRELMEETGYEAGSWVHVCGGPVTAGLTDEQIDLFLARDLVHTGPGGGDGTENITLHEAPLRDIHAWLAARATEGLHLDTKVFVALFFLGVAWDGATTFGGAR